MNAHHLLLLLSEQATNGTSAGNSRSLVAIILAFIVSITVYCLYWLIDTCNNKIRIKKENTE